MKFLTVKLEGADLIDRFCGYSTRVEIKDLQGPKGFFFLHLTEGFPIPLKKHPTTPENFKIDVALIDQVRFLLVDSPRSLDDEASSLDTVTVGDFC